jgi:hypothetical protein
MIIKDGPKYIVKDKDGKQIAVYLTEEKAKIKEERERQIKYYKERPINTKAKND